MYKVTFALRHNAPSEAIEFFNAAYQTLFSSSDECTITRWKSEQSLAGESTIDEMIVFQFRDKDQADRYFGDRRLTMFHRTAANFFNDLEVRCFSVAPGQ